MLPPKAYCGQPLVPPADWKDGLPTECNRTIKPLLFFWGKTESRTAAIVAMRAYSFIRFHWLDSEYPREYFELKMTNSELTNDFVLEIIDFAAQEDVDDSRELWDSQVETLRRTCGF